MTRSKNKKKEQNQTFEGKNGENATLTDLDLDTLLSEVGGGVKIVVSRLLPRWCDGHLDTLYLDEDEVLSLEDLREQFGGRRLRIRVLDGATSKFIAQRDIKFPDPPRANGRTLPHPEDKETQKNETNLLQVLMESQSKNTKAMLEAQQKQAEMMQRMMGDRLKEAKATATPVKDPMESLKESMGLMEFIEGLRERIRDKQNSEKKEEGGWSSPLLEKMADMAEMFFSQKLEHDHAQFRARLDAQDSEKESPSRPLPDKPSSSEPTLNTASDADILKEAADRFKNMSTVQQKSVIERLFAQIGGSADSDESLECAKNEENIENGGGLEGGVSDPNLDLALDIDLDPDDLEELRRHAAT